MARRARRSRRTLTTVLVLVLISLTVITLDESGRTHHLTAGVKSVASDVFSPIRSGVDAIVDPIGNVFAGAVHYDSVVKENQLLRAQIARYRQQSNESAFERRQLADLQRLAAENDLPSLAQLPTVLAQETSASDSNFAATIDIDKGRDDGVDVGMPVVGAGGLVGQVTFAGHHTATVTLLTDGSSKVGVAFGPGNVSTGTVDGQGPGNSLSVQFVTPGTPLHRGESLYTNGLAGSEFPPGIPVASVTSAHTVSGASQESVQATPLADLGALAYVEVVQWSPAP